jgi:spore coat protein U-like protein
MKHLPAAALIVIFLCSTGVLTFGASKSLTVSTTVNNSCAFTAGDNALTFGTYDAVGANATTPLAQIAIFQLQCTNGTTARVLLDQGQNPSAASTDALPLRNMTNGAFKLSYQLYTTSTRTTTWDNLTGVSQTVNGTAQPISIYGSIPAGQNVPSGTYTDTVIISVNY